jgi:hypothetical protein
MLEVTPMLFSSNRGRMRRSGHAARKGRCPPANSKPAVECLESRTLPSLFGPATNYGTGPAPFGVAVGDINGDGIPDIVAVNQGNDSVSVLLGKGNGTFLPNNDYAVGSLPVSPVLGDLNKDGRLDIVVVNDFGESASVLLNNGNGTFARTDYAPGIGLAVDVALGDLNGDGALDMVIADYSNSGVATLLNNGDGTFTTKAKISVPGDNTRQVALGDVNNDGKLDLAVTYHNSAVVSVLLGKGDGTFGPGVNYARGPGGHGFGVAFGDVDSDGHLDMVATNFDDNTLSMFMNHGDGTFGTKTDYTVGVGPQAVLFGDLDSDGHLDIICANYTTNNVSVLLGHGDGTFGPKTDFAAGRQSARVALGDVNGDGKLDAVTGNGGDNTVSVLLNTSNTTLSSLSIADASVKENPLGTRYVSLPVTLSAASDQTVTVHYDTAPGTATPGIDYVGRHGTLTFLPGQTTRNVRVHILNDQPTGVNEQFFVNLSNAANATIADDQAVGTIVESTGSAAAPRSSTGGPAPSPSGSATALANDSGSPVASFFASLLAPSRPVAVVPLGTAQSGVDSVGRPVGGHALNDGLVGGNVPIVVNLGQSTDVAMTDGPAPGSLFADHEGEPGL